MRRSLAFIAFALLVVGVFSVLGLWWALGPGAPKEISSAALPPLPTAPSSPAMPANPENAASPAPSESPPSEISESAPHPKVGLLDQGTLFVEARGQRFATENYALERLPSGEIVLQSQGTLTFKIAFINTQATFAQAMRFDAEKRPLSYQLAINGPIGIGNRKVSSSFSATQGLLNDGEKESTIDLPEEPFLLLGMFSSYTILTLWADEPQSLKVISLRGERRAGSPEGPPAAPTVTLERLGAVSLKASDGSIVGAEEYLLRSERFALKFYRDGARFLGMRSVATEKEPEGSFSIYRSDLFPKGFDVLSSR